MNKDLEYYKKELEALIMGDLDTLREEFGLKAGEGVDDFVANKLLPDSPFSGFAINKSFDTDVAEYDDAHVFFYRDPDTSYIVSNSGDFLILHDREIFAIDLKDTDNAIYDAATKIDKFADNEFYMIPNEVDMRAAEPLYTIKDDEIKPIRKSGYKP